MSAAPQRLAPDDARLAYQCPLPVDRRQPHPRLERFPPAVHALLAGQIGPLANLRSSSGCALLVATDSPWIALRLDRLRHHQPVPVGIAAEIADGAGGWTVSASPDLREVAGELTLRLATGLERGAGARSVAVWLPLISTCALAGIDLADGAEVLPVEPPRARWLAIGDSLAQGFCVQCPTQAWVHRLSRRWDLPAWNLGVGGLRIETQAVAWALADRAWDLVTIGLGSNHCWRDADAEQAGDLAVGLARLALAGGHRRVVWCLPPYKACEDGKGPAEFAGVPLDATTGARVRRVRDELRARLSALGPGLEVVEDLMPRDPRLLPDGLHPAATGMAAFAERLAQALGEGVGS